MAYAQALQALGDPTRRSVLEELRDGPRAVGEIAARLPVSRPAGSQHLPVLKEAGLAAERTKGPRGLDPRDPAGPSRPARHPERFWAAGAPHLQAAAQVHV